MNHCKDCIFWKHYHENEGHCHRFPKVAVTESSGFTDRMDERAFEVHSYFRFAPHQAYDWCGEWKPRVEEIDIPGFDGHPGVH